MKKLFTLAAAVLASFSLWAAVEDLSFSEPTALPEGYVYSNSNKPAIVTTGDKSCIYVTDGGGGTVTTECFTTDGFDASKGKRWMGFETDEKCRLVINVYSNAKTFTLYKSDATAQATYTNSAKAWEDWTIDSLPAGKYILSAGSSQCYVSAMTFTGSGVPSTDPVASVVIAGPEEAFTGAALKYTMTTDVKANEYKWYINGLEQAGQNAKTFTFTPSAEGNYQIAAAAKNDYNEALVASNTIALVVTPAPITDTYIWRKGSGYTGCVDNPDVAANANQAFTDLEHSTATMSGISSMGRAGAANTEVSIVFEAEMGYGITSICTYGKLEEAAGAEISWDGGATWTHIDAYSESAVTFDAPAGVAAPSFTIKFISVDPNTGGLWWRNALVTFEERPASVISYDANGGSGTMEATNSYVADECAFTAPAGKEFDVWNTAADGSGVTYYAKDYINSDVTLYAIWRLEGAKNTDATLSALSVAGYTLSPAFDADVHEYTITKPYGAANPELSAVTAETHDRKATGAVISNVENGFSIEVTAEDPSVYLTYTISILEAEAKKDLLEATFSNGVHGYIKAGKITVPYLAGEGLPTFVEAHCWNADSLPVPPIAGMVDDKLVVTGADGKLAEYSIEYVAINPAELVKDSTYTFDTAVVVQPSYIYSVYGWDSGKGVKFSKDVEEANNRRISEGKDRIYMALPAAKYVYLTSGSGESRPVKILINGVESQVNKTAKQNEDIVLALNETQPNFIAIESNGNSGDAGFIKIRLSDKAITYPVVISESLENGTIEFADLGNEEHLYAEGDEVHLVITPAEGYQLVNANAGNAALTPDEDGKCSFVMPGQAVTVSATFELIPVEHAINIGNFDHGSVEADKTEALAGATINLTVTPEEGYRVASLAAGNEALTPDADGKCSFVMPDQDVTISATFELIPVAPTYLVSISAPQNGTIEFADLGNEDHKYAEGDEVHLVITPAEGYKLVNANAGNAALTPDEDGKCSFVMPGQDVTVSATFAPISQGIEDVNAADKAVKRIQNGMLIIEKNGRIYNILGARVK